jgi:peptidyl-prolyl cis-trans isomerase C
MRFVTKIVVGVGVTWLVAVSAHAQVTPPSPSAAAATVNGQAVPESAVARALKRVPPEEHAKARKEVIEFLIENALVDQYLASQKIVIEKKDADARIAEVRAEIKKGGQDPDKVFAGLMLSEEELREQIEHDLRWEKFALAQATDVVLRDLFDKGKEFFDGSQVRARHILVSPAGGEAKDHEAAKAQIGQLRKDIETALAKELDKLPPTADALTRDQERIKQIDRIFSEVAREKSACPSKRDGGELPWFPRVGSMVESFATVSFTLKPFELSDVVTTPFGYHLILCTGRKPGQEVKFEQVKDEVREVYCNRLRDAILARMRPAAKIVIAASK